MDIIMNLKRIICLILVFATLYSLAETTFVSAEAPNKTAEAFEQMADEYAKQVIDDYKVAGAAICVVKDGKIFFKKGYGYSDIDKKTLVNPDTTAFQIASVSKLFTATAAMQMVEQGKLSLDKDVNSYLTEFKVKNPFSKPVTLRTLLTHTSGLDEQTPLYLKSKGDIFFSDLKPLQKELKERMPSVVREPGSFCQYNVYGMALAGYLVEKVSGKALEEYITDNILKPLNMKNSSYGLNKTILKSMSKPYRYKDGKYSEEAYTLISDHPSGSVCSTASDMANFMLMQLSMGEYSGTRVLSKNTAEEMQKHQYPQDGRLTGYGLGFYETIRNGYRTIDHGGYLPSFSSRLTILPEKNIGMFIVINTDSKQSGKICNEFTDKFYDFFTPKLINAEAEKAVKSKAPMDIDVNSINGSYIYDGYGHNDVTKIKSVLVTCNVQCDKEGNLKFKADGINWNFKYTGEGYFYSEDSGNYCRISERNGRMVLGSDYEKVSRSDKNLFTAAIIFLPVLLISLIVLPILAIRNRKRYDRSYLVIKGILLLLSGSTIVYFGLIVLMALKCSAADTYIVLKFIMPLINAVCYIILGLTVALIAHVADSWIKSKYLLRSRVINSIFVIISIINVVFMYKMNGFNL
jgi:CubicO group peptidase (beta-lactamase class C family)